MKFVKSLSLPVLSLALLLPVNAPAGTMQDAFNKVGKFADSVCETAKKQYEQMPTFEQSRAIVSQKLGLQNKSFQAAVTDAKDAVKTAFNASKDAVVTYSIKHPYIALSAAAVTIFGTGYLIARKLNKNKKSA